MDINKAKYIYFYSPFGTSARIILNLKHLGLDQCKRIRSVYAPIVSDSLEKDYSLDKYKDLDVLYLDEFYENRFNTELIYKFLKELSDLGIQIVMASHDKVDKLINMPKGIKDELLSLDLDYSIKTDVDI